MEGETAQAEEVRQPSLLDALIPLLFMIALLALSVVLFGLDASLGPLQVALFMSAVVAAAVAHKNGHAWKRLGEEIVKGISLAMSARMFMVVFRQRGLHPETLATAVENAGTVTSPLIPWNSCGAYMSAALGVSTFVYFPYCFFNFLNFILGLIYGFAGINIQRLGPAEPLALAPGEAASLVAQER